MAKIVKYIMQRLKSVVINEHILNILVVARNSVPVGVLGNPFRAPPHSPTLPYTPRDMALVFVKVFYLINVDTQFRNYENI